MSQVKAALRREDEDNSLLLVFVDDVEPGGVWVAGWDGHAVASWDYLRLKTRAADLAEEDAAYYVTDYQRRHDVELLIVELDS